MSKKHPQISVVVATYNRPSMLARCLKGLAEQGYEDFEVIIINDGGRNISKKDYESSIGLRQKIYNSCQFINNSKHSGSASVRNQGFALSQGQLVAFLDDDAIPQADWLFFAHEYFKSHPETTVVNGKINAVSMKYMPQRIRQAFYDYRDYIACERTKVPTSTDSKNTQRYKVDWISLGNCFFNRQRLAGNIPLFDERQQSSYGHKLAKHLQRQGHTIGYSDKILITHHHPASMSRLLRLRYTRAIDFAQIACSDTVSLWQDLQRGIQYYAFMLFRSNLGFTDKLTELTFANMYVTCYLFKRYLYPDKQD